MTHITLWSCLISCVNIKWIRRVLLEIQSGHDSVHGWADGQGETSIRPSTSLKRGYEIYSLTSQPGPDCKLRCLHWYHIFNISHISCISDSRKTVERDWDSIQTDTSIFICNRYNPPTLVWFYMGILYISLWKIMGCIFYIIHTLPVKNVAMPIIRKSAAMVLT